MLFRSCDVHRAAQDRDELAGALAVVALAQPKVLVEIGCDSGGGLWAWGQVCPRVYGITLEDNAYGTGGSGGVLRTHGVPVHLGSSHAPTALVWLRGQLAGDPVDVLVIDGDHSVEGVKADLADYAPLVATGGLILLHDIDVTNDPRAQVCHVWPELVERYETTVIRSTVGRRQGWGIITWTGDDSPWT